MASSIHDLVALKPSTSKQDATNAFTSRHPPVRMGNAADIAYGKLPPRDLMQFLLTDLSTGGCALAFAVNAATSTVSDDAQRLYSMVGHFLSAARADRELHATVVSVRDTKNFATRTVSVTQILDDGTHRAILSAHLDYQRIEPATLLSYSVRPSALVGPISAAIEPKDAFAALEKLHGSKPGLVRLFQKIFEPMFHFFDWKYDPASLGSQNMLGMLRTAPTSQDHLPTPEKTSFDWWRCKAPLNKYSDHATTLAFLMDAGVSFIPLSHSKMFLQDAAVCSSLDFAIRIFVNDMDLNKWHLKDLNTIRGGSGRTFSRTRLFDERGELVAEMSQQSILRPHRKAQL